MQGTLQGLLQLGSTLEEMGNDLELKCISHLIYYFFIC